MKISVYGVAALLAGVFAFSVIGGCVGGDAAGSDSEARLSPEESLRAIVIDSFCWQGGSFGHAYWVLGKIVQKREPGEYESLLNEMACIARAKDCDSAFRCAGMDPTKPCVPGLFTARCDGSVAVSCQNTGDWEGLEQRGDCAVQPLNSSCYIGDSGDAICGVSSCSDDDDGGEKCVGTIVENCWDNVLMRDDCADIGLGMVCMLHPENADETLCSTENPCDVSFCDGSHAVDCDYGFERTRFDCGWYGDDMTCVAVPDESEPGGVSVSCGLPPGDEECGAESGTSSRCNADLLQLCVGGKWISFDCSVVPGGTCTDDEDGVFCTAVR